MSESNPFAFAGLNVPQLSSSEASLRAELAKSKQNVAMLQREVQDLKDANGIAQALAAAKNQVQEAQRESKRAQIAERTAKAALDALRNASNMSQEKERSMSQKTTSTKDEVDQLRQQLLEAENKNGELQVELEKCKGLLANTAQRLRDTEDDFDNRVHTELEGANTTIDEQRKELQDVKSRLNNATTKVQELESETYGVNEDLETVCKDNTKLSDDLTDQKNIVVHLRETNDNLVIDLAAKEAQRKALVRERDDFEVRLKQTLLALKEREQSEAEARNALESFKAETELVAHDLSEQNTALQVDIDTYHKESHGHERVVALKDERIALLERENEMLEDKLKEEQMHNTVHDNIARPPTYRSVSTVSHRSLADELSDAEFDDDESVSALSEQELATKSVDLELSDVREVVSIIPHPVPTPKSTVSTMPRRPESFIEYSQVSNVSSIEPAQPPAPRLSVYNDTVASVTPSEPAPPTLSLSDHTVAIVSPVEPKPAPLALSDIKGALDYTPIEPSILLSEPVALPLSLFKHTVASSSPSEPRVTPLILSNIHTALDSVPVGPTISTPTIAVGPQELSLHVDEALNYPPVEPTNLDLHKAPETQKLTAGVAGNAGFSIEPDSGTVFVNKITNTNNLTTYIDARRLGDTPNRKSSTPTEIPPQDLPPPCISLASPQRKDSGVFDKPLTTSRRRRSPMNAFARLGKPANTDTDSLNKLTGGWPVERKPQDEPSISQCATPTSPNDVHSASGKGLRPFIHYFLHALMFLLALHWCRIWSQLRDWEHANGVGFGEGYGSVHDRYGQYGNGHVLLGMLPHNLLSADSPLPVKAVNIITSTVSALEGWIGYGPTPTI